MVLPKVKLLLKTSSPEITFIYKTFKFGTQHIPFLILVYIQLKNHGHIVHLLQEHSLGHRVLWWYLVWYSVQFYSTSCVAHSSRLLFWNNKSNSSPFHFQPVSFIINISENRKLSQFENEHNHISHRHIIGVVVKSTLYFIFIFWAEARTQAPLIPGPRGEDDSPRCRAHSTHALPFLQWILPLPIL